ncbi:MAG: uroporphyrinogen-III synthase [Vibrio sp.]
MTVLVTRPDKDGEQLCDMLTQKGISAIHHSLIGIQQGLGSESLIDDLSQADIVIAVSQHAVHWAWQTLQQSNATFPSSISYFAIGQKTAQLLEKHTSKKVRSPQISDSEHLLDLPALKLVSNQRILILRGNGGRELICATLQQRGAKVKYNEIYARILKPIANTQTWQDWKECDLKHIVITSGEQLAFFMSQIPAEYLQWVVQLTLYVPSLRIKQQAHAYGFTQIINTGSAANPVLLQAISETIITGQNHDR